RPWFQDARSIKSIRLREMTELPTADSAAFIALVEATFDENTTEIFTLPLTFASMGSSGQLPEDRKQSVLAQVKGPQEGVLFDALEDSVFCAALLEAVANNRSYEARSGELRAVAFPGFAAVRAAVEAPPSSIVVRSSQPDTVVEY